MNGLAFITFLDPNLSPPKIMSHRLSLPAALVVALVCVSQLTSTLNAQQSGESRTTPDEVIRINTELIQSPVIVLDKQGNFVPGLTREQFELTINNRAHPVTFFEEIIAGTAVESAKFEALRKGTAPTTTPPATSTSPLPSVSGRTIIFFIDDYHLNSEGVTRTRAAVLNFIDRSLGQNDRALVISAIGQIGFLQQLTDNKDVLRAAINRIKHREFTVSDEGRPVMTAYQALAIQTGDSRTMQHFADMAIEDIFQRQTPMPSTSPGQAIAREGAFPHEVNRSLFGLLFHRTQFLRRLEDCSVSAFHFRRSIFKVFADGVICRACCVHEDLTCDPGTDAV